MLWVAIIAWAIGVAQAFINERHKLAWNVLLLGASDLVGIFYFDLGWMGLVILAVLAVVILIANKLG